MERRVGEVMIGEAEKRTILCVFSDLRRRFTDSELNTFIGSVTLEEMYALENKLSHEDYCIRHGIEIEDMTEADYEQEYYEKWCW